MRRAVPGRVVVRCQIRLVIAALVVCVLALAFVPRADAAALAVDAGVTTHESSPATTITSGALTTSRAGDLIVAFIASDGPNASGGQSFSSVTGGGLNWRLRQRTNTQPGTAEIWEAVASTALSNVRVTATRASGSYIGSINVIAFSGADTTTDGAVAGADGARGAPAASLTATRTGSWVWGVGDDWDQAVTRVVGSGQSLFDQDLASVGDTYWVQSQAAAGNTAGASVTLNDTSPTIDGWDFSAIEVIPASSGPPPPGPPVISNVASSGVTSTSATITWTTDIPSDSQVLYGPTLPYGQSTTLDATQVTSHSQTITGLSPSTPYHFAVQSTGGSSNQTATSTDNQFTTLASNVTPPDMEIKVPMTAISIGANPGNGDRQLQFTHITWDAGSGPFEIDPTYNSQTGVATFTQALYQSPSPGVWKFDHSVPVAATGVFQPPSDYQFPLTKFTLNNVNPDGSIGSVVATSPKTDYCITGDAYVGGVPNAPNQTYIPQSNCTDPTKPLGWSVGWGDEYDQTDSGQPIDLTGIADGTYILRGTVDPNHVITESDTTNNVTDTLLQIAGNRVSVISQSNPGTSPPTVSMTRPADGASVSGTVQLQASASAASPATVTSVQFLLDGQPLGSPVTTSPYTYDWTVGSTPLGSHTLSARVTDSNGNVATASAITVTVVASNPCSGGDTTPPTVSITNPTSSQTVSGTQPVAASTSDNCGVASVQFLLDGKALGNPVTSPPYAVSWDTTTAPSGTHILSAQAIDTSGNQATAATVTVTVQNPAPPMTCFVMQVDVSVHAKGTARTAAFHTAAAGETLLAFVSADGPKGSGKQTVKVSGAGLTWTLVKRANAQSGDSEVWKATAANVLSNATVTSTLAAGGYRQDLTVVAYEGVLGVGASAAASGAKTAPSLKLTTAAATSLVFAVGNDWDNAIPRTLPPGWTLLDQWVNTAVGDDYWSQYTNTPTGAAGSVITVNDTAPTTDSWNMVAIELLNDGG
jgi:Bacterial Ig domain/Lysyl oxidase